LKSTFNIMRGIKPGLNLLLLSGLAAALLLLAWRSPASGVAPPPAAAGNAPRLVAILQYLETDYPAAVASGDSNELAEQRSLSAEAASEVAHLQGPQRFADRVESIDARVREGRDPAGVSGDCVSLVDDLVTATGIVRAPLGVPDLEEGAKLYAQSCASCHGPTGHGDGPAAAALRPRPADFHSDEVMASLTPFKAFNVVRFGVRGTAMAPFTSLDERQRWALAFYLFTLRQPPCHHAPPRVSLDALANRSDGDLAKSSGAPEVACLRERLPELDPPALLAAARSRVAQAARLADAGDRQGAEGVVLDAYLTDIEPIEPWLRARDGELVVQLEASFTATRASLQLRDPSSAREAARLLALLDRAAAPHEKTTVASVFGLSVLVIVREGFEAAVIIAALLAVVKKRKEVARARLVHAGWMSALALGAVVFVLGRSVLAGAMNEKLEGCLAFVATAMLLHAALWLNARSTTRRTMGALRQRTHGALDRGGVALFGIAFLAMFRETFETAVFLEALSIDAPSAVVWGSLSGMTLLVALIFCVTRFGLRLPMTTLFKVSTVVLVATAVVLVGQGVHSFEEVGLLSSRPLPFVRIEFLGIYPDRVGLLAQLAVALGPLFWKAWSDFWTTRPRFGDAEPKPGE
jgi:high-affinity iron transporter